MKYIVVIFSFLFCFNFGQNVKKTVVYYNYRYKIDSTDKVNVYKELMVLAINGNESVYKSYNKFKRDSIVENDLKKGIYEINFGKLPKVHIYHQVYYNKKNDSLRIFDKIVSKEYTYKPEKNVKWILGKEKKKIGEFDCQNAHCYIGKRKFEAWFTTAIQLNEGPYRFKGLPGLVVQVYDEKKYFQFDLLGIKNVEMSINFNIKAINSTEEKFLKLRSNFFKDPVGQAQIYLGKPIAEENKERVANNFKDNLFLEN